MAKDKMSRTTRDDQECKKRKRTWNDSADQMQNATLSADLQLHSRFMQLPQEIRDEIYANIFCSTRFAFRERHLDHFGRYRVESYSRGGALAILRTCRRVRNEIGVSWLHQVLFHFEDPESLLGTLTGIPVSTRKQIRRLRVSDRPLFMEYEHEVWGVNYRVAQVLKLLPGLEVDILTILGDGKSQVSYASLDKLIRHSDGWKELHWLSHSSEVLGYKDDNPAYRYLRQPQPADWQCALEHRDGQASRPSVVVYRATAVATPGAVLQPFTRKVFTQAFGADQDARSYGKLEDATLMRLEEVGKEVLIVVKRGAGVDYAEKEGSPYLPRGDIRKEFPGKSWEDIKTQQEAMYYNPSDDDDELDEIYGQGGDDSVCSNDHESSCQQCKQRLEKPSIVDTYSHVDEYTWPPSHFVKE